LYLLRVKKVDLISLGVFSPKRPSSTTGAFAVPFRVLSQKNMTGDNELFLKWYLLGVKNISSHATKQDLGTCTS